MKKAILFLSLFLLFNCTNKKTDTSQTVSLPKNWTTYYPNIHDKKNN